jgi:hypothetical protein
LWDGISIADSGCGPIWCCLKRYSVHVDCDAFAVRVAVARGLCVSLVDRVVPVGTVGQNCDRGSEGLANDLIVKPSKVDSKHVLQRMSSPRVKMGGAGRCKSMCRAAEQAFVDVYLVYVSNIAHVFDSNNIISFVYRSRSLTPFRSQVLLQGGPSRACGVTFKRCYNACCNTSLRRCLNVVTPLSATVYTL